MSLSINEDSLGVDELLKDSMQMREYVISLMDDIKVLKNERDKYMKECRILKEAMHLKDNASIERLEQIRKSATAQILEIEASQTLSKGLPDPTPRPSSYCDFVRPMQPQGEADDDVYSSIFPTPEKATADANGSRSSVFSESTAEKIELDIISEPSIYNSSPPPLPRRRIYMNSFLRSTSQQPSTSFPDTKNLSKAQVPSVLKRKRRNSLSKIIKNLSLKKDSARDGGWV